MFYNLWITKKKNFTKLIKLPTPVFMCDTTQKLSLLDVS